MIPVHPGRILRRELQARGLSANRLAIELKLPSGRITDILAGKRGISADTALRLGHLSGCVVENGRRLLLSPPLRGERGTPPQFERRAELAA